MIPFSICDFRFSIRRRQSTKIFCRASCTILVALCGASAEAQQPNKVPRIAYLTVAPLSANVARVEAFEQGLRELGYADGKNIVIEWRSGEGKLNTESELVAEALRLKVDVM